MKHFMTALSFGLGVLALLAVPRAKAGITDQKTLVTFNEPVTVANFVLEPGQYVFKLADVQADRQIVTISTGDERRTIGMVEALPASRPNDAGTAVSFYEAAPGAPRAVRNWFFEGETSGVQFPVPSVLHH